VVPASGIFSQYTAAPPDQYVFPAPQKLSPGLVSVSLNDSSQVLANPAAGLVAAPQFTDDQLRAIQWYQQNSQGSTPQVWEQGLVEKMLWYCGALFLAVCVGYYGVASQAPTAQLERRIEAADARVERANQLVAEQAALSTKLAAKAAERQAVSYNCFFASCPPPPSAANPVGVGPVQGN
jgi:hypothetical protein